MMARRTLLAVALASLFVAGAARAQDAAEFKVGYVASITGVIAPITKYYMDGLDAGIKMVNESGGVGGLPVRVVKCDSQSNEAQAVLCTKRLIDQDKVNMLLGVGGTAPTVAIEPTVQSAGIPLFAIAAGRVSYANPLKKWVFKAIITNDDQVPTIVKFLKKKGWVKVALIRDNTAFGNDSAKSIKAEAASEGIDIVADEVYSPTDTDITAQLTRIRGLQPQAVINYAVGIGVGGLIAREMIQLGMNQPSFVGMNQQIEGYAKNAGVAGTAHTYFVAAKVASAADLPKDDPLYGPIAVFTKYFKELHPDQTPNSNSPTAVDALLIAQAAGKAIGKKVLDREALREAIENVKNVPGLQGFWTFTPREHWCSLEAGAQIVTYTGTNWVAAK
jgi:branched-chain amino acid transport system substrate-binding protein